MADDTITWGDIRGIASLKSNDAPDWFNEWYLMYLDQSEASSNEAKKRFSILFEKIYFFINMLFLVDFFF